MKITEKVHVVQGETVSIALTESITAPDGTVITASAVTAQLYKLPKMTTLELFPEAVDQAHNVVLVSKNTTQLLRGTYLLRVRITINNAIQVKDIQLTVSR